jgi:hypothetical protein
MRAPSDGVGRVDETVASVALRYPADTHPAPAVASASSNLSSVATYEYLDLEIVTSDDGQIVSSSTVPSTPVPDAPSKPVVPVQLLTAFGSQGWEVIDVTVWPTVGSKAARREYLLKKTYERFRY